MATKPVAVGSPLRLPVEARKRPQAVSSNDIADAMTQVALHEGLETLWRDQAFQKDWQLKADPEVLSFLLLVLRLETQESVEIPTRLYRRLVKVLSEKRWQTVGYRERYGIEYKKKEGIRCLVFHPEKTRIRNLMRANLGAKLQ